MLINKLLRAMLSYLLENNEADLSSPLCSNHPFFSGMLEFKKKIERGLL